MESGFFFLRDIVIVLGVGFVGAFIARRFKLPLLFGYLLGGFLFSIIFISRFTFDASLQTLADLGVALLLFTLGVEFSLDTLRRVKQIAIIGGVLQIALTILATLFILPNFGFTLSESLFLGSVFALSSTAVIVKMLTERGEVNTLPGEILVGILLLQDLAVIPLMIVLPQIFSIQTDLLAAFWAIVFSIGKAGVIIAATIFFGRTFVPILMTRIARLNSRELLLLCVVLLALVFAFGASILGLPPSIGAFLAGILVSRTVVNHAVFAEVRPLRDIFSILFFVLLGMFLSPEFFFANIGMILALFIFVVILKSIIVFALMIAFSYHTKTAFIVAAGLANIGEFAFILAQVFFAQELISSRLYHIVLATSLLTLLLTPWQIALAPTLYQKIKNLVRRNLRLYNLIFGKLDYDRAFHSELPFENHVVLLGHGRVGKVIARVLAKTSIPFVGVDHNLAVVDELKKKGIPYVYGDPSDLEVLDFAQVDKAKVVVVAVPDRKSQEIIIRNALKLNPKVKIIVRSHFEEDKEMLMSNGAFAVVLPEREAGYSIAQKIMPLFEK